MTPELKKEWYSTGDILLHTVLVKNIDGDANVEILTGDFWDGVRTKAQLRIWSKA